MARKNRFDPEDEKMAEVRKNPAAYTRRSRRWAGLREPVHAERMREFYAAQRVLPRAVRRLFRDPAKAEQRVRKNRAKVMRLLAPYGVHL